MSITIHNQQSVGKRFFVPLGLTNPQNNLTTKTHALLDTGAEVCFLSVWTSVLLDVKKTGEYGEEEQRAIGGKIIQGHYKSLDVTLVDIETQHMEVIPNVLFFVVAVDDPDQKRNVPTILGMSFLQRLKSIYLDIQTNTIVLQSFNI